ncbi:MAG: hypothetical protein Q9219_003259 [cf. Caloplaca sp. 3 TL-2023]
MALFSAPSPNPPFAASDIKVRTLLLVAQASNSALNMILPTLNATERKDPIARSALFPDDGPHDHVDIVVILPGQAAETVWTENIVLHGRKAQNTSKLFSSICIRHDRND